jgi:hypothetical protein
MTIKRAVDKDHFISLWTAGVSMAGIAAEFRIGNSAIRARVIEFGLMPRLPGWNRTNGGNSKPVADPKPASEAVYHPGLSAAIKRANGSVQRLGKVATSYRVPYREVLAMAGVSA